MNEEFLSAQDLATRWRMHAQTLTRWRQLQRGPPYVKLGKTVRYAMNDVVEFERRGLRVPVPPRETETPGEPAQVVEVRLLTLRDVVVDLRAESPNEIARAPT